MKLFIPLFGLTEPWLLLTSLISVELCTNSTTESGSEHYLCSTTAEDCLRFCVIPVSCTTDCCIQYLSAFILEPMAPCGVIESDVVTTSAHVAYKIN
jgi:hypothetical protein